MSRRTQRVGNLIRQTLAEALFSKLADPRVTPARTSLTRVEVPEDLLTARVYVSVIGTESEQARAVEALQHAAGRLQELLMRKISLRHTPVLTFHPDEQFKKTLQTLDLIDQAMDDVRRREDLQEGPDRTPPETEQQEPPR